MLSLVHARRTCYSGDTMTHTPAPPSAPAEFLAEKNVLHLRGDWTLPHYAQLEMLVAQLAPRLQASTAASATIDAAELGALDTAGAQLGGINRGRCSS